MAVIGSAFGSGLALGTASILSVGPNNLMMIREGLRAGRTWLVGLIVWSSYIMLLAAAALLTEHVTAGLLSLRYAFSWLGTAAVVWFAVASIRTALRGPAIYSFTGRALETKRVCFGRVTRVIWLNPLTYVELLIIPAAICGSLASPDLRIEFMLGLVLMTTVCCSAYLLGGGFCAALLRHPRMLQAFDFVSGFVLATVAVTMAVKLL